MYKELKITKISSTIEKLAARIDDRFPGSGISSVCQELLQCSQDIELKIQFIAEPNRWIRSAVLLVVAIFIFTLIYTFSLVEWKFHKPTLAEMIQITEALVNDVILVGAALFFLFSIEVRIKRQRALAHLHQLRSLAHVIDMHQLTKDPVVVTSGYQKTKNSPARSIGRFELQRYLDYCSEMFSLIGKLAALFSEKLPEPSIVSAANDIESLCTGFSRKVWQKMDFLR